MTDTFTTIRSRLDDAGVIYSLLTHVPEGQTEAVSALRGHALDQAAKCVLLIVKVGKKNTRFVLAVVSGEHRVDMAAIKKLFCATYAGFAAREVAERLAKSEPGTILPFAMDAAVTVVVDKNLTTNEVIFFNAARLDISMKMRISDYLSFEKPTVANIAICGG